VPPIKLTGSWLFLKWTIYLAEGWVSITGGKPLLVDQYSWRSTAIPQASTRAKHFDKFTIKSN